MLVGNVEVLCDNKGEAFCCLTATCGHEEPEPLLSRDFYFHVFRIEHLSSPAGHILTALFPPTSSIVSMNT